MDERQNEYKPKTTAKTGRLIVAAILILGSLFALGWLLRLPNMRKVDALAAQDPLPRVSLMETTPNRKPIELILPTSAQAFHYTPIWARVNGYILRYLVDIGDFVKEGDLLVEIDTPETDADLARAKADLLNSIAERDIAKVTSNRWQKLWQKNNEAVSKQEVDQYTANLEAAEATVLANEKNVARLTYQQQFKFVYAPFDGIITQRLIDLGTLVYGSLNGIPQELFQIVKTDVIRFFVEVPQTYYRQIRNGLEAEVRVLQFPEKVFYGTVVRFANALDPVARTLNTQINVMNEDGILYAGLYGQAKFLFEPSPNSFIIPTTAVIIRSSYPHVAVVDDNNIVHLKKVQIGHDYGNQMEIVSGLEANDWIVMIPSDRIREGVKVDIYEDGIKPQHQDSVQ